MRELGHGDLMLILLVIEAQQSGARLSRVVVALITLDSFIAGSMSRHTEWQSSGVSTQHQVAGINLTGFFNIKKCF